MHKHAQCDIITVFLSVCLWLFYSQHLPMLKWSIYCQTFSTIWFGHYSTFPHCAELWKSYSM